MKASCRVCCLWIVLACVALFIGAVIFTILGIDKSDFQTPTPWPTLTIKALDPTSVPTTAVPVIPTPRPSSVPKPTVVRYRNCSEVKQAGKAPIRAGDPGYSRKLDRDGDGIGCE